MSKKVDVFSKTGLLSQEFSTFEYRLEQEQMANLVNRAINEEKHCTVEAGTGTGKSLAYLFPIAVLPGPVVITTGTKTLQNQLLTKDIPLVVDIIEKYTGRHITSGVQKVGVIMCVADE